LKVYLTVSEPRGLRLQMDAMRILRESGVDLDSLVEAGFALYVGDAKGKTLLSLKKRYRTLLQKHLSDQNVALLISAASHLDSLVESESKGIFQKSKDPAALVADELIGMSIAEYLAGKKGLFNYTRYDKEKPGILSDLPPFMDDAVGALVAATMTRLFEE